MHRLFLSLSSGRLEWHRLGSLVVLALTFPGEGGFVIYRLIMVLVVSILYLKRSIISMSSFKENLSSLAEYAAFRN